MYYPRHCVAHAIIPIFVPCYVIIMPNRIATPNSTHTWSLRCAHLQDLPQLVDLINLAYEDEAFCLRGPRTDHADMLHMAQTGVFLILFEDAQPGTIAGTVFYRIEAQRGYMGMLAVAPRCRGQGLAKRLINAVEMRCRQAACACLDLTVVSQRPILIDYYAQSGFVEAGELPFPVPEKILMPLHLVQMCKAL